MKQENPSGPIRAANLFICKNVNKLYPCPYYPSALLILNHVGKEYEGHEK